MYENILEKAQLNIELMTLVFESLIIEPPEKLTLKNSLNFYTRITPIAFYSSRINFSRNWEGCQYVVLKNI